jgi:hypothetical protein
MINLEQLESMGYFIENVDGLNRVYRIKNSFGDLIATAYKESGLVDVQKGKIFNYKIELQKGLKSMVQP